MAWNANTLFASDDSTGVILKNERVYILHKVENGQGLYGIGRRYGVDWTKIRDANPGSAASMLPGQILIVPTGKTEKQFFGNKTPKYSKNSNAYSKPKEKVPPPVTKKTTIEKTEKTSFTILYNIKKGETLFSIAQKFGTTVDFLKQLNKLKSETVSEGMDLLVPMTEDTNADSLIKEKQKEAEKTQKELDEIAAKIAAEKKSESKKIDTLTSKEKPENNTSKETTKEKNADTKGVTYTIKIENFAEYDVEKVTETGYGKVTTDTKINQSKDWVIHHNAPENTIILITNPANNKTVYVKVVKNFERKDGDPLIIYLTKNTADYLNLNKKDKFAVNLSFAK